MGTASDGDRVRYVPIFGADAYDPAKVRADPVPFGEQLEAMQDLVRRNYGTLS